MVAVRRRHHIGYYSSELLMHREEDWGFCVLERLVYELEDGQFEFHISAGVRVLCVD
jgi:aminopeptidase-like protein